MCYNVRTLEITSSGAERPATDANSHRSEIMEMKTMLETTALVEAKTTHAALPALPFKKPAMRFLTSVITEDELYTYLSRMPDRLMHTMATRFAMASANAVTLASGR